MNATTINDETMARPTVRRLLTYLCPAVPVLLLAVPVAALLPCTYSLSLTDSPAFLPRLSKQGQGGLLTCSSSTGVCSWGSTTGTGRCHNGRGHRTPQLPLRRSRRRTQNPLCSVAAVDAASSNGVTEGGPATTSISLSAGSPVVSDNNVPLVPTSPSILLMSLQWSDPQPPQSVQVTPEQSDPRRFYQSVANVWRWKDEVLGDGRDYFITKPKAIRALQNYLLSSLQQKESFYTKNNENNTLTHVSECVILSNCARFEIMLVVHHHHHRNNNNTNNTNNIDDSEPHQNEHDTTAVIARMVSTVLIHQVRSYQQRPFSWLTPPGDWPGVVHLNAAAEAQSHCNGETAIATTAISELTSHWTMIWGPALVGMHLCQVAAGLTRRPRRPHRPVLFRPFSSRDAHILCQLKRTLELQQEQNPRMQSVSASSSLSSLHNGDHETNTGRLVPMFLRAALRAGKAARNPQVVPSLETVLRRHYGETGNNKKFDVEPPALVMEGVIEASVFTFTH